jgi:rare lipoprotein A
MRIPTEYEMRDAKVKVEPKSASASRPYIVRGKKYQPMSDEKGYKAEGVASWYGQKFHGYYTSNGEIFNMYDMTAAHKTLPLPSFVKVTNLENGKSAIVRVNDRGPVHDDRIIDLSYAAAYKLGYHNQGTAKVQIEAITLERIAPRLTYIQVAASSNKTNIEHLANKLAGQFAIDTNIAEEDGLHKLRLGPLEDDTHAQTLLENLQAGEFRQAFLLYSEQRL